MRKYTPAAMAAMLSALLFCGCSAASYSPAANATEAVSETTSAAETTIAETEEQTEMTAEALPPVSYPCEISTEELHCTYGECDLFGTLYTPANGRSKHPTVILSHGFNCIGKDMTDVAMQLAQNGIMAYTFDFQGGSTRSASTGDTTLMSITTEQEDLRQVIDMISAMESCDTEKLYLYGESQGGFVSALTGSEMPDRISGMFLVYPAFSIMDDWRKMDPETMTEPFNFNGVTLSRAFYDGLPEFDVYERIADFTNYVHIYQGTNDFVVALSYAEKIDGIFPDSELTVVEGAGHGFGGNDRQMVKDTVCEYFTSNGLVE